MLEVSATLSKLSNMIIICENCSTKFSIDDNQIDANGRFLHCTICEHEWLFIPRAEYKDSSDDNHFKIAKIDVDAKLKKKRRLSLTLLTLFVCMLLMVYPLVLLYNSTAVGITAESVDFIVTDCSFHMRDNVDHMRGVSSPVLAVHCNITNNGDYSRILKKIKVVIFDQKKRSVGYFRVYPYFEFSEKQKYKFDALIDVTGKPAFALFDLSDINGNFFQREVIVD